jgi:hypothetical protein
MDGKPVRFDRKPYGQENQLQNLLPNLPELLADGPPALNGSERIKWLRIKDEFPLSDGNGLSLSVDRLFLDNQGIPTLVEDNRSAMERVGVVSFAGCMRNRWLLD